MGEHIGYVERAFAEGLGALPGFGVVRDPQRTIYTQLLEALRFDERDVLERDPSRKQLIPYIALSCGDALWLMRRATAQREARLHGKRSLGVGGHLDAKDARHDTGQDAIVTCAQRELFEEVHLEGWTREPGALRYVGLLNDDRDEVGRVHLGVLFVLELPQGVQVRVREVEKMTGEWVEREAIEPAGLETWSLLLLDALAVTGA